MRTGTRRADVLEVRRGEPDDRGPSGDYAYDPSGKRVKKMGGAEEFYFYGIGGQKLATMVCVGPEDGQGCGPTYNVYFGGKLVKSKGAVVATDRLGSVRASSTGDRMTYYPYGEERSSTADGREKFGTYMRDSVTQDYADQRYYAVGMGRFNTADPYQASGGAASPASWNRYTYVHGDPINFSDPTGQLEVDPDNDRENYDEDYVDEGGGGGDGGDGGDGDGGFVNCAPGVTCFSTTVTDFANCEPGVTCFSITVVGSSQTIPPGLGSRLLRLPGIPTFTHPTGTMPPTGPVWTAPAPPPPTLRPPGAIACALAGGFFSDLFSHGPTDRNVGNGPGIVPIDPGSMPWARGKDGRPTGYGSSGAQASAGAEVINWLGNVIQCAAGPQK